MGNPAGDAVSARRLALALLLAAAPAAAEQAPPFLASHAAGGLALRLELGAASGGPVRVGEPALLRLRFATGEDPSGPPARFLRPAAWAERDGARPASCRERVRGLLQPRIGLSAAVDFNAWQLGVVSDNGALHVIDPIGGTARTRLLALVNLGGKAGGVAEDRARDAVFVAVPALGEVVEIDSLRWGERRRIATGGAPRGLLVDADGASLWVDLGTEVLRLDRARGEVAARVALPGGAAALVPLAPGVLLAAGPAGAALLRGDAATPLPLLGDGFAAAAFSPLAEQALLLDARAGRLLVVTAEGAQAASLAVAPGAAGVFLDPSGRLAFVPEPEAAQVTVVDLARGEVAHRIALPGAVPLRVGFSRSQAFVQSAPGARIAAIALSSLGESGTPAIAWIAAGEGGIAPGQALGDLAVAAPGGGAMLMADPAEGVVQVYTEGMAAPSGALRLPPGTRPLALLPVDRALREVAPGLHEAVGIFPQPGRYAIPVMLQGGGFLHCFTAEIGDVTTAPIAARLGVELAEAPLLLAGAPARLQLRLRGPAAQGAAWMAAEDLELLAVQFDGHWSERLPLQPLGEGLYAAEALAPPRPGPVLLHLRSRALGLEPGSLPHLVLQAGRP
jgi:DNA-binding beta-propeller fold protein YncE